MPPVYTLLSSAFPSSSRSKHSVEKSPTYSTRYSRTDQRSSDTDNASDEESGSEYETLSIIDGSMDSVVKGHSLRTLVTPAAGSETTGKSTTENAARVRAMNRVYACTHDGCHKSYRKPSRLQEHERSHTGERPFICLECGKSYLRESHLRAHTRSHLPTTSRPFACTHITRNLGVGSPDEMIPTQNTAEERTRTSTSTSPTRPCGQRFWTMQHLRAHELAVHYGEKPYKCSSCSSAFAKHGALRVHVAENHAPPGTKPYQCENPHCSQSFSTSQKLKTHARVHDVTRYSCVHPDCSSANLSNQTQFSTWTALQAHMRSAHPPRCPYPSCNGRTFASSKGLRGHIKTHRDQEIEDSQQNQLGDFLTATQSLKRAHTELGQAHEDLEPQPKKRRGGEVGRDWPCPWDNCNKAFKSKKAQVDHLRVSHEGSRNFSCPEDGCTLTFGYKHVMQRHLERHHRPPPIGAPSTSTNPDLNQARSPKDAVIIGLLTGQDYHETVDPSKNGVVHQPRGIACPWPNAFGPKNVSETHRTESSANCAFMFRRAYDLRRHLRSAHGLEVDANEVGAWVLAHKC